MVSANKFVYKVNIETTADIFEFVRVAVKFDGDVYLVNGKHRLNAKSYLGVALAKMSWDKICVETEKDCYFDFEKFII